MDLRSVRYRQLTQRPIPSEVKRQPLILASASPQRAYILELANVPFEVLPCPAEPRDAVTGLPQCVALRRAVYKTSWVARRRPQRVVLGADTVIAADGELLGKPQDRQQAYRMLAKLVGRAHWVYTGFALTICLPGSCRRLWQDWDSTQVKFRPVEPEQLAAYVATGEPHGKAGGYGIQGRAASLIEWIRGSYYNVVGLPLYKVLQALRALDWEGLPAGYHRGPPAFFASLRTRPVPPLGGRIGD